MASDRGQRELLIQMLHHRRSQWDIYGSGHNADLADEILSTITNSPASTPFVGASGPVLDEIEKLIVRAIHRLGPAWKDIAGTDLASEIAADLRASGAFQSGRGSSIKEGVTLDPHRSEPPYPGRPQYVSPAERDSVPSGDLAWVSWSPRLVDLSKPAPTYREAFKAGWDAAHELRPEPSPGEVERAAVAASLAGAVRFVDMHTLAKWMRAALRAAAEVRGEER